ncbi:hypothetical protein BMS3Abin04_02448 [bacterium BMS3Abin04]|nr:hypothetical protein BMS3Abin04_02448 [bacterium BMS3Abin04]
MVSYYLVSSIASQCNHIDHVRTQLSYALAESTVTMVLGDFLTAYGIALLLIFAALYGILMVVGKRVG